MPAPDRLNVAVFAAAALIAAGVVSRAGHHAAEIAPVPVPAAATTALAPTASDSSALDPRARGWDIGKRYDYTFKLKSSVAFGQQRPAFDFDLVGELSVRPIAATPTSVTARAVIEKAKIASRVPGTQSELEKLAAQLGRSDVAVTLTGGLVSELHVPKGATAFSVNTYRSVTAGLQVARPAAELERYTAAEYDSTGKYLAEYAVAGQGRLEKRKQRYLELLAQPALDAAGSLKVVPHVESSEGELRLTPEGRPSFVSMTDRVQIKGAQAPVVSVTSFVLEAQGARPEPTDATASDFVATLRRVKASEAYGDDSSVAALDNARINGLTFDEIVAQLEKRPKAAEPEAAPKDAEERAERQATTEEDSRLFIALAAILRQRPQSVREATAKIKAQSRAADVLIDALASASTPATERALVDLLNSKSSDPALKSRIVAALGRVARPTDTSIQALKAILAAVPYNPRALFGLGTYARRLRDQGSTEEANRLGEFLLTQLDGARTVSPLLTTLRAIANSGYTPALPKVRPYLTDQREQVRVDAVRALQSMRGHQIDAIIAARLAAETSRAVRISAIRSSQVREPSEVLVGELVKAATDADPHVRYAAVEAMIQWLPKRDSLRASLQNIARTDKEPRVRERITTALAGS